MRGRRVSAWCLLFLVTAAGLSSCLARRRVITRAGGNTKQALLVADRKALIDIVARQFASISDFSCTVDMVPALGTAEKSKITEYKDVRGYILLKKPDDIRIIGLFPVVRNKAFDMVSDGKSFKLYVPTKNRFIVGKNELTEPSPNKVENLRPQHFQDAMLVQPVDPAQDKVVLENLTDEDNAAYILHLVRENGEGGLSLSRTVWFSRLDLRIARQIIFDGIGNILTDARYSDWQVFDGVPFPKHIDINRPRDEYSVVINVVKMEINKGLTDDKFELERPEGSTLQTIGSTPPAETPEPAPAPPAKGKTRKK